MNSEITFLFWNLSRRPLATSVARIAERSQVDVLILSEYLDSDSILSEVNRLVQCPFHLSFSELRRIVIATRFSSRFVRPVFESAYISIRRLRLPDQPEILLAAAHLRSKLHRTADSQNLAATRIARQIEDCEDRLGHTRTLLVGDLNMNPFEAGVAGANGLHAVATRQIARQGMRTVEGQEYRFFYNPMWSFFGDNRGTPPGTFYRRGSDQVEYFWHVFDQVLVRPALLERFSNEHLQVLTTDGEANLLNSAGTPDKAKSSDHLPLLFRLRV